MQHSPKLQSVVQGDQNFDVKATEFCETNQSMSTEKLGFFMFIFTNYHLFFPILMGIEVAIVGFRL